MNKLFFAGILLILGTMIQCTSSSNQNDMITHTVFFSLNHEKGSNEEAEFIRKALELGKIPSVHNLRCVKEVSPKNSFDFGLIMQFKDQAGRSEEHTSELQSRGHLVCRLLLEKKK